MTEKMVKLGATGEFPDGSFGPHDEGALTMGVATDKAGNVHVNFGCKISWFAMPPEQAINLAINLARLILRHAGAKKVEIEW